MVSEHKLEEVLQECTAAAARGRNRYVPSVSEFGQTCVFRVPLLKAGARQPLMHCRVNGRDHVRERTAGNCMLPALHAAGGEATASGELQCIDVGMNSSDHIRNPHARGWGILMHMFCTCNALL